MTRRIHQYRLLLTFLWCTVLCGALIAMRFTVTDHPTYLWLLVPNLVLAWIPYVCSSWISRRLERGSRWTLGIAGVGLVWLFFFPNCFYIITDIVHIGYFSRSVSKPMLYYDISLHALAVILGWGLGVVSLLRMQERIRSGYGVRYGHAFALLVLALGSIGVYLGRFLRWNSWDLLRDPMKIVRDTVQAMVEPDSLAFIVVFGFVTGSLYYLVYNLQPERSR